MSPPSVDGVNASAPSAKIRTNPTPANPVTAFLKDLLENINGARLLAASSSSWKQAIYQAVGAPATADEKVVAKALEDAMKDPHNQFAILLKTDAKAEPFVATFPSDVVEYDGDKTAWCEVRLRGTFSDELLVTMSITLERDEKSEYKIRNLDWQDFRDEFYPGLSGREWLRAF
jgi:hypothetical protein